MSFGETVNLLLYILSGICFGVFASRYSVLSALHIKARWHENGITCCFGCIPQLLFLGISFFLFPTWFISKTATGGFFYYAVLAYFFNKGIRIHNSKN